MAIEVLTTRVLKEHLYDNLTDLCRIMRRHGSDKGITWHNYTPVYDLMFSHLRDRDDVQVFELGIGTNNPDLPSSMGINGTPGASLRGWKEWMPKARIVGADIDRNILFREESIETYYVDQRSANTIHDLWSAIPGDATFDIIIDDGLHTFEANDNFLRHSHDRVRPGGFYIIEDILEDDIASFEASIPEYKEWFAEVVLCKLPHKINKCDNNLLILYKNPLEADVSMVVI